MTYRFVNNEQGALIEPAAMAVWSAARGGVGPGDTIASNRYGSPFTAKTWGFVAGAVAAFLALAIVSGHHLARPATLPPATRATFNVVPVVSVLVGAAAAYAVPWPPLGYPVAGAVAVSGYVLLVSLFFAPTSG